MSFLDFLLIHQTGLVTSRKLVLLDNRSSFDTLGAERVSNAQNVYEPLEFC